MTADNRSIDQATRTPSQFVEYELLLRIISVLLSYKYRIFVFAFLVTGGVIGLSLLVEPRFSASSVVAVNLDDQRGGVSPEPYRGNNTLGVLEYDLIMNQVPTDEKDRHLARLESYDFLSEFLVHFELLPVIMRDRWDPVAQEWVDGSVPDMRDAVNAFRGGIFSIGKFGSTDMISINVTTHDPALSTQISRNIPQFYNIYNRELELQVLADRRAYLEDRLRQVTSKETQSSIYRILESQISVESLLFARKSFPLETIRPAIEPQFKTYPKRKSWAVLAFVGSVAFSVFAVLFLSVFKAFRADLGRYNRVSTSRMDRLIDDSDEWVDKDQSLQNGRGENT